ncbi:MAG: hypothetical protein V3W31_01635 [Thermodesulfobacteriota bacterium]
MNGKRTKKTKRAAGKQFFGCVLLFLGTLNTMLSLKAGLPIDPFYYVLLISGGLVLAVGIWQGREREGEEK